MPLKCFISQNVCSCFFFRFCQVMRFPLHLYDFASIRRSIGFQTRRHIDHNAYLLCTLMFGNCCLISPFQWRLWCMIAKISSCDFFCFCLLLCFSLVSRGKVECLMPEVFFFFFNSAIAIKHTFWDFWRILSPKSCCNPLLFTFFVFFNAPRLVFSCWVGSPLNFFWFKFCEENLVVSFYLVAICN